MRQNRPLKNRLMAAAVAAAVMAASVPQPLAASETETPVQETGYTEDTPEQGAGSPADEGAENWQSDETSQFSETSETVPDETADDQTGSPDMEVSQDIEVSQDMEASQDMEVSQDMEIPDESQDPDDPGAPPDPQAYLSAVMDNIELTVYRQGESEFPGGMTIQLIPAEETEAGTSAAFEAELKAAWTDTLYDSYLEAHPESYTPERLRTVRETVTDSIELFETCYVKLADAFGSEAEYDDLVFDFHIRDTNLYRQVTEDRVSCAAGRYVSENGGYVLAPDNGALTVVRHEEEQYLTYSLTAGGSGYFTLLTTDNGWEAPDAELSEENYIQDEETEEPGDFISTYAVDEAASETSENEDEEADMEEELAEEMLDAGISLYAAAQTPVGTRVTASGTGYTVVSQGDRVYSSAYTPVKAHANSTIIPWNNAGSSVTGGVFTSTTGSYLLPSSKAAAGQFGFLVTNVSYNTAAKCNVDLLITVSNYENYTYDNGGNKISKIYPYFGLHFTSGRYIGFDFDPRLPMMEVKCDFVMSGTNIPVAGNYRLKMLDIDQWQRFGISMQNGEIAGKYALDGSQVYVGSKTAFEHSYTLFNGDGTSGSDDPLQSVMYELANTSGIYLLIQLEYRNDETTASETVIRKRYDDAVNGVVETHGKLSWDGTAYGPTELTVPAKYVSNDGADLAASNTLPGTDSSYYYTIDHFVPEEAGSYYYSAYQMYDDLPAGASFDGAWSVVQMESGADVTGWFGSNCYGKHVEFNADGGVLASADFYGYHYRFTFRVRLEPAEAAPVYDGNTATYTVVNTGHIAVNRSGPSGTLDTNAVTTTAWETRLSPEPPVKGIDGDPNVSRKTYDTDYKKQAVVFSIFQKVPSEPAAWSPASITMTDVLQSILQYDHCEVYLQEAATGTFVRDAAWSIRADGQTVSGTRAYDPSLAGGTIRWDITCRVKDGADLAAYYQIVDGKTWAVLQNTAKTKFDWTQGSSPSAEQSTNTVTVLFPISEINILLSKTNADTGENISNAVFTVYEWDGKSYGRNRGEMTYVSGQKLYRMTNLARTNTNGGKYKVVETTTPYGHTGTWEQEFTVPEENKTEPREITCDVKNPMSKGTITVTKKSRRKGELLAGAEYEIKASKDVVSPQGKVLVKAGTVVDNITTGKEGKAVSKELYPGEYLVTETKAPLGYALDAEPQAAAVTYQNKNTPVTNVNVTFSNDRLYGIIELTKELDAEDIVWAHGNPVFTFKVQGEDVLGVPHTYYDTVEFTRENVDHSSGKARLKAVFKVLAGTYTSTEEITMRYALESIHSVTGGEISSDGQSVYFDLSEGGEAAAVFSNIKTTDEDEGHTDLVRNVIISEE